MDESTLLGWVLALPWLVGPLLVFIGRKRPDVLGWVALGVPVMCLAGILTLGIQSGGEARVIEWVWVPSLGLNLSFLKDGLSLMYGGIVAGMGCLVIFYARFYLKPDMPHAGRFYCYLCLFMGAMLGTVFANGLVLLFVFWELTGIASFLLIGFTHEKESARVGARQALLVTGATGLLLFVGVLLLRETTGMGHIDELLGASSPWGEWSGMTHAAMVLILLGAFGKSAQVPFHFWLPNAMAAPTPVSAYLHSATMVKLGVFLSARMYPVFGGRDEWMFLLTGVGMGTMVIAGVFALLSQDLKGILAYSTVSQLGCLIGYYGMGGGMVVGHDFLHLVSHVFYKGGLFMVIGIVSLMTGAKDIRELGGLWRQAPWLGVVGLIGAASMAGLPGTLGFISKEALLEEALKWPERWGGVGWYAAVSVVIASVVKVAFSIRLFAGIFLGQPEGKAKGVIRPMTFGLLAAPALLGLGIVVLGVYPALLSGVFREMTVAGLNGPSGTLHIWHGFTPVLGLSGGIVLFGWGMEVCLRRWGLLGGDFPSWLRLDRLFEASVHGFSKGTVTVTRWLRSDTPTDFLPVMVTYLLLLLGGILVGQWDELRTLMMAAMEKVLRGEEVTWQPMRSMAAIVISIAVMGVLFWKRWTTQLISLSVAGFLMCFYFILYRAPDLALTQILVETVTLILVLLLLARFPTQAQEGEEIRSTGMVHGVWHAGLSLGMGILATGLVLVFTAESNADKLGWEVLSRTIDLAHGSNAVNTILVDFRGFDTLGEVTVLVAAMLGCLGLLMRHKRSPEGYQQGAMGPPGFGVEEDSDGSRGVGESGTNGETDRREEGK